MMITKHTPYSSWKVSKIQTLTAYFLYIFLYKTLWNYTSLDTHYETTYTYGFRTSNLILLKYIGLPTLIGLTAPLKRWLFKNKREYIKAESILPTLVIFFMYTWCSMPQWSYHWYSSFCCSYFDVKLLRTTLLCLLVYLVHHLLPNYLSVIKCEHVLFCSISKRDWYILFPPSKGCIYKKVHRGEQNFLAKYNSKFWSQSFFMNHFGWYISFDHENAGLCRDVFIFDGKTIPM